MLRILILIVFCLQQFFPFSRVCAASRNPTTLVVQPFHDGSEDEASGKTAEILRQKLRSQTSLNVINPQIVDQVLSYHRNFRVSSREPSLEGAKDLLARAKEHYFQFAYSEAQAELRRTIQLFENNPHLLLDEGSTLLDSWITLALVHAAQGKKGEAIQDFQNVLKLNPFYKLDSKGFAPSVHKLWGEAKSQLPENQNGLIEIKTDPKVAEIYLNGIYQGVAPLTISSLPAGDYFLSFKANNYRTVHQKVSVRSGQNLHLNPKLFWEGAGKTQNKKLSAEAELARHQIEEGTRIAELLKVDKVLFVNVDSSSITTRMVDRRYRAGHNPIVIARAPKAIGLEEHLDQLVRFVFAQTELNLLKDPMAYLDPAGVGDPILLGRRRQKIPKGVLFGGLGAAGLAGILIGVLSAGGSGPPKTGTVALSFK